MSPPFETRHIGVEVDLVVGGYLACPKSFGMAIVQAVSVGAALLPCGNEDELAGSVVRVSLADIFELRRFISSMPDETEIIQRAFSNLVLV